LLLKRRINVQNTNVSWTFSMGQQRSYVKRYVNVLKIYSLRRAAAYLHDDVVDGYVDEFDEEPDETHDAKTDGRCVGRGLELCGQIIDTLKRKLSPHE